MCFGERHSWLTFIFGSVFVGLSAYKYAWVSRDALVICMIMGLVVVMQLWEALAWRGFCGLASWGGYISILLQPAPLLLLLWPLKQQLGIQGGQLSTWEGKLALGLMVLYYGTVFIGADAPSCILGDGKQIRYTWFRDWWQKLGYLVVFGTVPLLLMRDQDIAWYWILVFYTSLIVTQWVYGELHANGSIWCYYGAASAVLLFAFLYYKFGADGSGNKKIID
jgi:hypothetical protein